MDVLPILGTNLKGKMSQQTFFIRVAIVEANSKKW